MMPDRIRDLLPWRVQRALTARYYLERFTQAVFRAVLRTPPIAAGEGPVEVLTLLDHRNVRNYLLAIKSLLLHSFETPAVTVLSDGTLRPADVRQLEKHIPGIRVLAKEEISVPSTSLPAIQKWCTEYRYLSKLMHLPFASRQPLLLFLDSDVLFHRDLPANFFQLSPGMAATYNRDHDHSRYDPHFHYLKDYAASRGISLRTDLNCGLMLWDRAQLNPLAAIEFLEYLAQRHGSLHAVAEQDAWTLLASQLPTAPLPVDFLVLSNWECNTAQNRVRALATHYVSGERYRRLDYLQAGWRIIRRLLVRESRCKLPSAATSPSSETSRGVNCR
jgi:hypothetical protein